MGNNFLNSGKWVATMWIFQEWGEMCFKRYSIANHRNVPIHLFCSSTLHGWYKNNPPFIQMVWELSLGSFQHFKTPPVSGIFQTLWVLIFFPRNKHLFWNHSIIFWKCQIHWNPPQHFRFVPILHLLLPQPVPQVWQSSHSKTSSLHWFVSSIPSFAIISRI